MSILFKQQSTNNVWVRIFILNKCIKKKKCETCWNNTKKVRKCSCIIQHHPCYLMCPAHQLLNKKTLTLTNSPSAFRTKLHQKGLTACQLKDTLAHIEMKIFHASSLRDLLFPSPFLYSVTIIKASETHGSFLR